VRLLEQLACGPVAMVGTSMGGLMAITMAAKKAWPLCAVVLNDIGPALESAGLSRILETVGQGGSFETWMHAARHLREQVGSQHPDNTIGDWLAFAKRVMVVGGNGRIVFDYDMRIAEPLQASNGAIPDLWPAFDALKAIPTLVLRGEASDLLSEATVTRMLAELPGLRAVTILRVGHPPTLAEPEAQSAIHGLLAEVA
jgi:pimeloyl-ACP methyl ester carboxylesterase